MRRKGVEKGNERKFIKQYAPNRNIHALRISIQKEDIYAMLHICVITSGISKIKVHRTGWNCKQKIISLP